jgi:hypothetical protein
MKRAGLLMVPLFLLVVLVVAVAAQIPNQETMPADVRTFLDQYLADTFPIGPTTIVTAQRAERPWNFVQDMSGSVYDDSVHLQISTGPTKTVWTNLAALYYPPQEIWCVLLKTGTARQPSYSAVFVGVHVDLYNAGLVVHQANRAPGSPELAAQLSALGCDLPRPADNLP